MDTLDNAGRRRLLYPWEEGGDSEAAAAGIQVVVEVRKPVEGEAGRVPEVGSGDVQQGVRCCDIDDMEVGIAVGEEVGSSREDTEAEQRVDNYELGELEGIGIHTLLHVDMVDNLHL